MPDHTASQLRVGDAERERAADQLAAASRGWPAHRDRTRRTAGCGLVGAYPERSGHGSGRPAGVSAGPPAGNAITIRRDTVDPGWTAHLTSYLAVIAGLWLIWALTGFGHPWPIWPMLGWGLGLLGHRTGASTCSRLRAPARG